MFRQNRTKQYADLLRASKMRLNNEGSPSGIKVQGYVALQRLAEGQHGLEVLEVEGDISCVPATGAGSSERLHACPPPAAYAVTCPLILQMTALNWCMDAFDAGSCTRP